MNFFKVLLNPDREELENKERMLVATAANLLQVGEFQLLQLAYRNWFNEDLPVALIDRLFSTYMIESEVPHWARHYARKIIGMEKEGRLDDCDPAYHRYDSDYHTYVPRGMRRFCYAVAAITMFVGGGIALANMTVGTAATMFPPYLDENDLRSAPATMTWGRSDTIPPSPGIGAGGGQP